MKHIRLSIRGKHKMVLENLKAIKLRAVFQAEENGELPPYLGSMVPGILGHAMRNIVCIAPNVRCHLCEFATNCNSANFFNSPGTLAGSVKPYVIHVPIRDKVNWRKGELLPFEITFFGNTTTAADYYVAGLLEMGNYGWGAKRLKFSLQQITNVFDDTLVWSNGKTWVHHLQAFSLHTEGRLTNSVLLQFNSPTRILVKRKLLNHLNFEHVVGSIMTRIKLLLHAYEGVVLEWNEAAMLEEAKEIKTVEEQWQYVDFKRYSRTYNRKLSLPSITGYVRYEGDITSFTPLLEIGELIQIGKNTTHGFGNYNLYYA